MTTPNPAFMEAFDRFKKQIDVAYDRVREHIKTGHYNEAQEELARIAQVHAKTSLSMRNFLIRNNLMPGDD